MILKATWVLLGIIGAIAILIAITLCHLFKRKPIQNEMHVDDVAVSKDFVLEEPDCKEIPLKEIYAATNNLSSSNYIGQGIAGKVYKGVLSNGWHVAIKHIIKDGHAETFVREITSLSHVRHPNLVTLRGYCEVEDDCFLVYELCPNGCLSEWLFGKQKKLSWIQRIEIATGCARGLWFLHTFSGGCIVHRDIKPTNILLGDDFEAKLSDFGLSKVMELGVSHVSSEVRGTFGYVDPEYRQNRRVNAAGDVYSFGMVLLQIISGNRILNLNVTKSMPLDKMAKVLTKGGKISEFADPRMNGEFSMEAFELVFKLALSCTAHKHIRPSMEQVVTRLESVLELSARENHVSFPISENIT